MARPLEYIPIRPAAIGLGGHQNSGINVVRHYITGEICIEKRIPRAHITAGDMRREIQAMAQCGHHTNIVGLLTYDEEYSRLGYGSIIMQHCELGSLDTLILRFQARNARLSDEGFIWKALWDLSLALCFLWTGHDETSTRQLAKSGHASIRSGDWNSIIHRDIKPGNMFLKATNPHGLDGDCMYPTLVLGDFGCSVSHADMRAGQAGLGVLPYNDIDFAPPEAPLYCEQGDVSAGLTIQCLVPMEQLPFPRCDSQQQELAPVRTLNASERINAVLSS